MEISVENGEDKGYLNLFHKGDVIVHDQHYYLIVAIDKDDDRFPLSVSQLDGLDGLDVNQYLWGSLPENPEEKYIVGVNLFPASQYHLSIVKNVN